MEVALTPDLEELVTGQIRNGNYPSAGEVIRDALRLFRDHLELREQRLADLREDVSEGIRALDQGELEEYGAGENQRLAADIKTRGRERLRALREAGVGS